MLTTKYQEVWCAENTPHFRTYIHFAKFYGCSLSCKIVDPTFIRGNTCHVCDRWIFIEARMRKKCITQTV